jgi:hypothetical protein
LSLFCHLILSSLHALSGDEAVRLLQGEQVRDYSSLLFKDMDEMRVEQPLASDKLELFVRRHPYEVRKRPLL